MKTYFIKAYVRGPNDTSPTIVGDLVAGTNVTMAIQELYDAYNISDPPTWECFAQVIAITEVVLVKNNG